MERRKRTRWLVPTDWPLFYKMVFGVVVVVVLALVVTTYVNARTIEPRLREKIGGEFVAMANAQVSHLADILSEKVSILRNVALAEGVRIGAVVANTRYSGDETAIEAELLDLDKQWQSAADDSSLVRSIVDPKFNYLTAQLLDYQQSFQGNARTFLTDRYGGLVAATSRPSGYCYADEAWWLATYNNGRGAFYVGHPEFDSNAGEFVLGMAVPVISKDGKVIGVVHTTFLLDAIYEAVGRVEIGETGRVTVIDSRGFVVADRDPARVGQQVPLSWYAPEILEAASGWRELVDGEGVPVLAGHAAIREVEIEHVDEAAAIHRLGWVLFVHQAREEANAPVDSAFHVVFLATGVFALVAAALAFFVTRAVVSPITDLAVVARRMAAGDLTARAPLRWRDETGELAEAFNRMADEVARMVGELEGRVAERTQALAYRTVQLETAAQVSEAAGRLLDPGELEEQVVALIQERFDYYYVGLFLMDEHGEWTGEPGRWAVLRAGTGEAGRQMLETGHKLEVGGDSMIGGCVAEGLARIALDVGEEAVRFDNPLLPETRSEMAMPLITRGQVIGAISVQSVREAAFGEQDISILQTMATQVANAIQNARLFERVQASLAQTEVLYNVSQSLIVAGEAEELLRAASRPAFEAGATTAVLFYIDTGAEGQPEWAEAVAHIQAGEGAIVFSGAARYYVPEFFLGRLLFANPRQAQMIADVGVIEGGLMDGQTASLLKAMGSRALVVVPLTVGQRWLGMVVLSWPELHKFSSQEEQLYRMIGPQLAALVENQRLVERTQASLAETELLYNVGRCINEAEDLQGIVAAVVEGVSVPAVNRAVLFTYERGKTGEMAFALVAANWYSDQGTPPMSLGTRYPWAMFSKTLKFLLSSETSFFDDIQNDGRIDLALLEVLGGQNIRAMAVLPLWIGTRQLGALLLEAEEVHHFAGHEIRPYRMLLGQMAVAVESMRLLEETHRRATQLETAAEVSRVASSILDVDELLTTSVNLICDRFDWSYVGLFLVDETGKFAVLRAGSGEAGQARLAAGHKLVVGGESMVGWCVANARARIVWSRGNEGGRLDDSLLADACSEVALPLIAVGETIGALTVRSAEDDILSEEDIAILQSMADQIANAVSKARMFEQTQRALAEAEAAYRRYLQQEWEAFFASPLAVRGRGFEDGPEGTVPVSGVWARQQETGALAAPGDGEGQDLPRLVVPIKLRGETIGVIDLEREDDHGWTEGDQTFAESLAEQLGLAIENTRLSEQAQYRARREHFIRQITDQIRGQTDLDAILQTTVVELGKALGTSRAVVRLGTEADFSSSSGDSLPDEK